MVHYVSGVTIYHTDEEQESTSETPKIAKISQ